MKALFISTSMPPCAESQTIRNIFLIQGLARRGIKVVGLSPAVKGGDASMFEMLPKGMCIHRTRPPLYNALNDLTCILPKVTVRVAQSLLREAFARVAIPDLAFDWEWIARRSAEEIIRDERPDVLVSSSGSFTAHFAASKCARNFNLPWIADAGDPLSLNPLPPLCYSYMRAVNAPREKKALAMCSAFTLTTEETIEAYRGFLPRKADRLHYVPCGYSSPKEVFARHDGIVEFAYVGVAGRYNRDLRYFMQALDGGIRAQRNAPRCRLRIVGSEHPAFRQEAEKLGSFDLEVTGWVSYEKSLSYIHSADYLILQGNRGGLQIPAKAYHYLASGAPIIYIGEQPPHADPTHRLLARFAGTHTYLRSEDKLATDMKGFLQSHQHFREASESRRHDKQLACFSWENIGNKFAEIVEAAAHK